MIIDAYFSMLEDYSPSVLSNQDMIVNGLDCVSKGNTYIFDPLDHHYRRKAVLLFIFGRLTRHRIPYTIKLNYGRFTAALATLPWNPRNNF